MTSKTLIAACLLTCAWSNAGKAAPIRAVVDVTSGYLLGGSDGKKWFDAKATSAQLKGGEIYRLLETRRRSRTGIGRQARAGEAPCPDTFFVDIQPRKGEIAVDGNWKTTPRAPRILSNNAPIYRKLVGDILRKHGVEPVVKITQILRVDLEGDGQNEVLVSATRHKGNDGFPDSISPRSLKNEYSMVFLRKVVGGKVVTQMLDEEYYPKAKDFNAPNIFTIAGVWDLNGDGKMEIVTRGRYYEGDGTMVYEMRGGKAVKVLESGCGA